LASEFSPKFVSRFSRTAKCGSTFSCCLPQNVQEQLVTLITRHEYQRVDSKQVVPTTARILATIEIPLSNAVAQHRIIPQLAEAFSPAVISVPPLRERRDDIPLLAHHFLNQFRQTLQADTLDIATSAMQKLRDYQWPGNVRELRNLIERVLVLYGNSKQISTSELPQELMRPAIPIQNEIDYDGSVAAYERSLMRACLRRLTVRSRGYFASISRCLGNTPA
jgi:DNA-binding NtrC family response regulator